MTTFYVCEARLFEGMRRVSEAVSNLDDANRLAATLAPLSAHDLTVEHVRTGKTSVYLRTHKAGRPVGPGTSAVETALRMRQALGGRVTALSAAESGRPTLADVSTAMVSELGQ